MVRKYNEDAFRAAVVKGWAFRDLPVAEVSAIRAFLESGDIHDLPESYHSMFELVAEQMKRPT